MAQPQFGAAGVDSITRARRLDILELTEGIDIRQFRRMARPANSSNISEIEVWGITAPLVFNTSNNMWAESVTLSLTEEGIQHEAYNAQPGEADTDSPPTADAVVYDANYIMRVRASLSVTARIDDIASALEDIVWPTEFTPALAVNAATFPVGISTLSGAGEAILRSVSETDTRVDWRRVNYEMTWIVPNPDTTNYANMLTYAAHTAIPDLSADHFKQVTKTVELNSEGFGTESVNVDWFPKAGA